MVQTVAVIGAGAGGLTAVKSCLEEGLQPTCYEMSDTIGGLWHYNGKGEEGRTTVMKNTVANVCKELSAFSDFPPPVEDPIYMHHTQLDEYLCSYADTFDLRKHVHLNTKVIQIWETDDHEVSGQWCVKVENVHDGVVTTVTFDAVLVCIGVLSKPKMPDYPGIQKFQGKIMHTHEFKTSKGFEGKTTVVVGIGNSAVDAAVDISDVAKQVYISSRNGTWIFGRLGPRGQPNDLMVSRLVFFLMKNIPSLLNQMIRKRLNAKIDHNVYGINPKTAPSRSTATVNDHLPYLLLIGAIKMKPNVKEVHEHGVEFVDGTTLDNVDAIVYGTGYLPEYPFLASDIVGNDKSNLYLAMFPPERKTHTLAIIGCFRQKGPILPVMEMQNRFATRVFKGLVKLPDTKSLWKSIRRNQKETSTSRIGNMKGVPQIDFLPYLDHLASMIGCKPNLYKLMFQDPKLAREHIFGSATPYQFRLTGPHTWSGARDAILNQYDRAYGFLNKPSGSVVVKQKRNSLISLFKIVAMITFGYAVYRYYDKLFTLSTLLRLK